MTTFVDIAVNLADDMFQGVYNGKEYHDCDITSVLERSMSMGIRKIIITGTHVEGAHCNNQCIYDYMISFCRFSDGIEPM